MLEVKTVSGINPLPLSTQLERRNITSIAIRKPGAGRKSATGAVLASQEVVDAGHLKIVNPSGDHIAQLPLNVLERDYLNANPLTVSWDDISTTSSHIVLDVSASGYNSAHVIELIIGYDGPVCRV